MYEDVIEARESIKRAILSTKSEKMNTLVRIVKARTPDLSSIEVSQDDKIKALLDRIYNEIKQLNNNEVNISQIMNYSYDMYDGKLYALESECEECEKQDNRYLHNLFQRIDLFQKEICDERFITELEKNYLLGRTEVLKERVGRSMK